jgi:hypothetical protein
MDNQDTIGKRMAEGVSGLFAMALVMSCVAAWFTHLYICFTAAKWGFLIAGAIFFPIAIVHGAGHWFGAW